DAGVEIVVDDDVFVFGEMAHLLGRFGHPRGDDRFGVLGAGTQPRFERLPARRQHENRYQVGREDGAQLLRTLPLNVADAVAAIGDRRLDRLAWRTVAIAEHG